ncbi:hypothetical protein NZ30_07245 [Xanthomonas translucens pv. undulosa]|nr:hypothetical protein NZ30_07245 [Xanthomonas translucens pv. undulosa]
MTAQASCAKRNRGLSAPTCRFSGSRVPSPPACYPCQPFSPTPPHAPIAPMSSLPHASAADRATTLANRRAPAPCPTALAACAC